MPIDIHTNLITLLGKPLSQSYSARMQNAAYQAAGLNLLYFYTEAEEDHLQEILQGLRWMKIAGLGVTKPNKVAVMKYVDEIDPLCEQIGACNTILRTDGKWKAYNTDGTGFLRSFKEEAPDISLSETDFLLLGAGGASRAIGSVLAFHGARRIWVSSRGPEKAKELVSDLRNHPRTMVEFVDGQDEMALRRAAASSQVILNNTGVGMGEHLDETPFPKEYFHRDQLCFDACYNPQKTRFLREAEASGCRIMNGLGMLLYQGVEQFELWSGKPAPVEVMRRELLTILEENVHREVRDEGHPVAR